MQRWHWLPISLVACGVATVWLVTLFHAGSLGASQVLVYLGGAAALGSIYWLRRSFTEAEIELEEQRRLLSTEQESLAENSRRIEAEQKEFNRQIEVQLERLDKREQNLAERFVAFHEWLEYPQPVDLRHPNANGAAEPNDAELAELARKDREVMTLLQAETRIVFDHIVNNRYAPDGIFQALILRDDLFELITRVARIYNPDADQPLLETSLARVTRGLSRASLHFLSQLDELPLNVKDYNIKSLYGYVRQAVNAYKTYKSAEPYFPYANAAWYLGRLAMGANPLSLGAWWFAGSVGKQSAQAVANHLVNRQALGLLGNLVRVVGYEVAGLYGGDFRRRDPNWIYAAELTDLVSRFPLSRDSLAHALKEIGTLQLRSEYDRVFLYRCLASQKSADPVRYRAPTVLTGEERRAIAERLEKFCETFVHGTTPSKMIKWQAELEQRLAIKIAPTQKRENLSHCAQREDALRSLASFLLGQKEKEPLELPPLLRETKTYRALEDSQTITVLKDLDENPPFFFEQPNLDPTAPVAETYLQDLAALQVRITPRARDLDEVVADTAAYLRREPKKTEELLDREYVAYFQEFLDLSAPVRKIPGPAAAAALDLLQAGERARFIYGNVQLDAGRNPSAGEWDRVPLWLIGINERLVLFTAERQPRCLWTAERGSVELSQAGSFLNRAVVLKGGAWQLDADVSPAGIRLAAPLIPQPSYFKPLADWVGTASAVL